jgi:hypothetical protein
VAIVVTGTQGDPQEQAMTSPQIQTKRYPIRGALYGILLGLSAAYFLYFQFAMFPFDSVGAVITRMVIILVIGMVIGVIWAYVAPARKPKEPAPVADEPPPAVVDDEPPAAAMDEEPPAAAVEDEPSAAAMDDEPSEAAMDDEGDDDDRTP